MIANESNDDTKNTMSKSEIITIRVSKKTREQLKLFSKDNHENESQFIRHLIKNGLNHFQDKPKQVSSFMGKSIIPSTINTEYYWSGHEKPTSKLIFAMSLLLTIDTGKKTTEIIKLLQNYDYESETTPDGTQTRIKWENYYLELRRLIISHLSPSQTALVVIDTMILSFLSVIFPSPVFMASELSMLMIDSYDMLLLQNKRDNGKSI
ncbi:MAG: hypothetical protein GPJ54_04240 [Candidatus Heimdallarchaeota archaeon]|nr:hypothetical protein [Candidatus Heimdallarchaeota archaeon]